MFRHDRHDRQERRHRRTGHCTGRHHRRARRGAGAAPHRRPRAERLAEQPRPDGRRGTRTARPGTGRPPLARPLQPQAGGHAGPRGPGHRRRTGARPWATRAGSPTGRRTSSGRLPERPWQDVLTEWWPRLLPGIAAGATHPVIRVGHAVRTLLDGDVNAPRISRARARPRLLGRPPPAAARADPPPRSCPRRVPRPRWTPYRRWPTRVAGSATGWRSSPRSRLWPRAVRRRPGRGARPADGAGHGPRPTATPPTATAHPSCWCTPRPHPTPCCVRCPLSPVNCGHTSLAAAWAASAAVTAAYSPAEARPLRRIAVGGLRGRDLCAGGGARRRPHDQVHRHRTGRR